MKQHFAIAALTALIAVSMQAYTLPPTTAAPDASRTAAYANVPAHSPVRLSVPADPRSWSETARFFDLAGLESHTILPHTPSNVQRPMSNPLIRFTENRGQITDADGNVRRDILFKAEVPGAQLFMQADGISTMFTRVYREAEADPGPPDNSRTARSMETTVETYRLDMTLVGANPFARVRGEEQLPGVVNYYLPQCPDGLLGVREFGRIVYEDVYSGIDLELFSQEGRLKYNFIIRPGGRPADIRMRYDGAADVSVLSWGALSVMTPLGDVEEEPPECWTEGDRSAVAADFVLDGTTVGFRTESYDPSRTLVIDPWATYYGGSGGERGYGVAVDAAGNVCLCGGTTSTNIATTGAYQSSLAGGWDAFVVKFNTDGVRQWATYYGGAGGEDIGYYIDVAIDPGGYVYLAGSTDSTSDIATAGSHQSSHSGELDGFLVKFNPDGGVRLWATYFGGNNRENLKNVGVSGSGDVYICGETASTTNIATAGAHQTTPSGVWDAFLAKFDASGTLKWATYYGGESDDGGQSLTIDAGGDVYLCGNTWSMTGIATAGAHQPATDAAYRPDAFLVKFDANGVRQWGTYYGGEQRDEVSGIAVDGGRNVYIAGRTWSTANIATAGAHQTTPSGEGDDFLVKFNSNGIRQWGTFYGGTKAEHQSVVACGAGGEVFLGGDTRSPTNIATAGAYQSSFAGDTDAFLATFDANGVRLYGTYFGGPLGDGASGIAADASGGVYFGGETYSATGIATAGAHQATYGGNGDYHGDAFLVKFGGNPPPPPPIAPSGLMSTASTCTDVNLDWTDNSGDESAFIIELEQGAGVWNPVDTVPPNTTNAVIPRLLPSTLYKFRICADRMGVKSTYSNTATATTLPFPAPSELRIVSITSVSVELAWKNNTPFATSFVVEHKSASGYWQEGGELPGNSSGAAVPGLQPETEYFFRVRGFRGEAATGYSNIATARTKKFLAAPTAFQAVVKTSTEAELTWTDNANGETGYEIEQRPPLGAWTLVHTTAADASTYTRSGLTPDSTYHFRVRAVGDYAASDWSEERTVTMLFRPEAPLDLAADALDYRSVRLTWKRGSRNVKSYEIERRQGAGAWTPSGTASAGDTAALDGNLEEATTYWYRIRASNAAGQSDWSAEDSATTFAAPPPLAPFGLTAAATGQTSIRLTWLASSASYYKGFEIEESLTGNTSDFRKVSPDAAGGARSYDRGGLSPNTTSWYRVRGYNNSSKSDWSGTASATTTGDAKYPPSAPYNLQAKSGGISSIRLTWEMSDTAVFLSFDLERSLTSDPGGFTRISAGPTATDRAFTDTGLAMNTTYWYRLRAVNRYGESPWSNTASAETKDIGVTPELLAAMSAKEGMFASLETLIPEGGSDMSALRRLLGDHARGYDETAAKNLISAWRASGVPDPEAATDAMKRYALSEQAMLLAYGNDADFPGAKEIAREAVYAPALCAKNLAALILLWEAERGTIISERLPLYDAVMDDLTFAVLDGERTLSSMTGASGKAGSAVLHAEAVRRAGDVPDLAQSMLTSILPYYQQRILGNDYFAATQPLIAAYADRTARVDIAGTYDSAAARSARHVEAVKQTTSGLKTDFSSYGSGLTDMDAAFLITSSGNVDLAPFLRKMVNLRPRLIDNVRKAVLGGETPLLRAAYLASPAPLPGIGSLPSALTFAGEAAFDPVTNNARGGGNMFEALSKNSAWERTAEQAALDADRALLLELRAKVVEKDTGHIAAKYDALRSSGRAAVAELSRRSRPLEGITPASLVVNGPLVRGVLDAQAKSHRARALRTVLSAALADYLVDPQEAKNAPLLAEIDTILGYFDQAVSALNDIGPIAAARITEPVLSLDTSSLLPLFRSSPPYPYRLSFAVRNTGGAEAPSVTARVTPLDASAIPTTAEAFTFGDMAKGAAHADSMDVSIPAGMKTVSFSVEMTTGKGRSFVDHVTLAVPEGTTGTETSLPIPGEIALGRNYPNPFNPVTTITYTLPRRMPVRLIVTNVLGAEITRLVDGDLRPAGAHEARFDASAQPGGVYIYRLEVGGKLFARKMILVK